MSAHATLSTLLGWWQSSTPLDMPAQWAAGYPQVADYGSFSINGPSSSLHFRARIEQIHPDCHSWGKGCLPEIGIQMVLRQKTLISINNKTLHCWEMYTWSIMSIISVDFPQGSKKSVIIIILNSADWRLTPIYPNLKKAKSPSG